MQVTKWISYEIASDLVTSLGGLGGWANGHKWPDYLATLNPKTIPYAEAIRTSILKLDIKQGGDWHQYSDCGCPVFNDGTTATFSYRAWADLMACIWNTEEDESYSYMDFYMSCLVKNKND
jgi:hypothetical protein